jgi:hypothetical protein
MSSQHARIAARAYDLWKQRGGPDGSPEIDWYEAEKQVTSDDGNDATPPDLAPARRRRAAKGYSASAGSSRSA